MASGEILTIRKNSRRRTGKKPTGDNIICRLFDSINRGKMEQILLAYGLPKKNKKNRCSHNDSL